MRNLKVCCGRASCLIEFVSRLEEWADVASERGKQVVDPKGPLPRSRYPAEVFHCSWLRCLSGRSILFGRGIRSAEVPCAQLEA